MMTSVWPRVREQITDLPIAIASRIDVTPAWKSTSSRGMTKNRRVRVQLPQVHEPKAADLHVGGQLGTLRGVGLPRPRAGRGDDEVDVETADGLDQRRVVTALEAGRAHHPPRCGADSSRGEEPGVDHERGQHDPIRRHPQVVDEHATLRVCVDQDEVQGPSESERPEEPDLHRRRHDVSDHGVTRASAPRDLQQDGERQADLLTVGEDDVVTPAVQEAHRRQEASDAAESFQEWRKASEPLPAALATSRSSASIAPASSR